MPVALSLTDVIACAAVYWAFITSFCVLNWLTFCCSVARVCSSLVSCSASWACWASMSSIWAWAAALRDRASLASSSLPWPSAAFAWSWRWSTVCRSCVSCSSIRLRDAAMSTSARRTSVR